MPLAVLIPTEVALLPRPISGAVRRGAQTAATGAGQDRRRGKEAIGGRSGRVEWRFVLRQARGTACRHGRGGTGRLNNRVVRTLYSGGTEMVDNGDGAEDDAAATEEAREMGNNGGGREKDGRNFARG